MHLAKQLPIDIYMSTAKVSMNFESVWATLIDHLARNRMQPFEILRYAKTSGVVVKGKLKARA